MKRRWLKQYTVKDAITRGNLWLLVICIILIIVWRSIVVYTQNKAMATSDIMGEEDSLILQWKQAIAALDTSPVSATKANIQEGRNRIFNFRSFDPNHASIEDMQDSGVPYKIAKNIFNYRRAGGVYKRKADLKKLYAMNDSLFAVLQAYINIQHTIKESSKIMDQKNTYNQEAPLPSYTPKSYFEFNINTADKATLMQLKGIGNGFATRIIERRILLGGFYTVTQLKEIYGFPDSTYEALVPYCIIDEKDLVKIDFNKATEAELSEHPYIGKRMAKHIIKVRQDIGEFEQISDLRNIPLLNEEKYRKIAKYFKNP